MTGFDTDQINQAGLLLVKEWAAKIMSIRSTRAPSWIGAVNAFVVCGSNGRSAYFYDFPDELAVYEYLVRNGIEI